MKTGVRSGPILNGLVPSQRVALFLLGSHDKVADIDISKSFSFGQEEPNEPGGGPFRVSCIIK